MNLNIKKSICIFIIIQFVLALAYFIFINNFKFSFAIYLIIIAMPLFFTIYLVSQFERFKLLYEKIWFKLVLFICSYLYIIYSKSYASEVINSFFRIDSRYLPNTELLLTGIFSLNFAKYLIDFIYYLAGFQNIIIIVLVVFIIYLFRIRKLTKEIFFKNLIFSLIVGIYLIVLLGFLGRTEENFKNKLIFAISNEFDFNKKNICKNLHDKKEIIGVIYLSDNVVLANEYLNNRFEYNIYKCEYEKTVKSFILENKE